MSAKPLSTTAPPPAPTPPAGPAKLPAAIVLTATIVAFGAFMSALTTTVFNAATEKISVDLHSSSGATHWSVTAYLLGYAAVIPLAGWLARRFGAARLWLAMLAMFTVLSAVGAAANSIGLLIAARAALGMTGGLLVPAGQMLLAARARRDQLGRIMAMMGVPIVLAPLLGPTLGGILVDHLGWRSLFLINVPLCVIALVFAWFTLERTPGGEAGRFDTFGLVLTALGMPMLTYGIADVTVPNNPHVGISAGLIVAAVLLLGTFVWHSLRRDQPLLDLRLFANKAFASACITSFSLGAVLYGSLALLPLYFLHARGETPLVAGLMVATQAIGALIATPISGSLCDRFGGGRVVISGLVLALVSTIPLAVIGTTESYWWLGVVLVARGVATGLTVVPAMSTTYAVVRKDQIPHATPQLNLMQRLGGSLGIALLTVIYQDMLPEHPTAAAAADAMGSTHYWVIGLTVLALLPAFVLAKAEKVSRAESAATDARR
ncbi:DHA2 family efflux MFS transporter permease subunit [Actinokineospora enzanensis]|uniref:DHA2 family efflux MFS transporter permease subunit n=1 Tax=Actinokineospora enzanensis TaxID=155975 RepID=UPI0003A82D6C|nr:DHA2 family efflux MFS transporter permease subunit [Actinokineospora enzanensis]